MGSENITLRIMKTANGWYVEHEAGDVTNSYAVEGDAWETLNPALAGTFETPFKAPEENENSAEKPKVGELKEAAGGIDILQAIESAKKAQAQTNPQI